MNAASRLSDGRRRSRRLSGAESPLSTLLREQKARDLQEAEVMKATRREDLVLKILRNLQAEMAAMKREMATVKREIATHRAETTQGFAMTAQNFKAVIKRIDDHRAFAVDRLREHQRILDEHAWQLREIEHRLSRLESA